MTSVPRRLLLIALVFGIAGMHTMGHPGSAHGPAGEIVTGSDHSWAGPAVASAHDAASDAVRQSPGGDLPGTDPLTVCLAVLGSLALLTLALLVVRVRHGAVARPPVRTGRGVDGGRSPPKPTGVRLALLSVLRI